MLTPLFPVQTILFQFLFLLIAIAIEGYVLHWKLNLGRKNSIQYATSINLISTIVGWLIFFFIEGQLSPSLRAQMISYIFFDRFFNAPVSSFSSFIFSAGIAMFFAAFLIKYISLDILQFLLQNPTTNTNNPPQNQSRKNRLSKFRIYGSANQEISKATVVLLANAFSHSAMLALLIVRSL